MLASDQRPPLSLTGDEEREPCSRRILAIKVGADVRRLAHRHAGVGVGQVWRRAAASDRGEVGAARRLLTDGDEGVG